MHKLIHLRMKPYFSYTMKFAFYQQFIQNIENIQIFCTALLPSDDKIRLKVPKIFKLTCNSCFGSKLFLDLRARADTSSEHKPIVASYCGREVALQTWGL